MELCIKVLCNGDFFLSVADLFKIIQSLSHTGYILFSHIHFFSHSLNYEFSFDLYSNWMISGCHYFTLLWVKKAAIHYIHFVKDRNDNVSSSVTTFHSSRGGYIGRHKLWTQKQNRSHMNVWTCMMLWQQTKYANIFMVSTSSCSE